MTDKRQYIEHGFYKGDRVRVPRNRCPHGHSGIGTVDSWGMTGLQVRLDDILLLVGIEPWEVKRLSPLEDLADQA